MKHSIVPSMGWICFLLAVLAMFAQNMEIARLQKEIQGNTAHCVSAINDVRDHCTAAIKRTGDACVTAARKY